MVVSKRKFQHRIFRYSLCLASVWLARKIAIAPHAEMVDVLTPVEGTESEGVTHTNPQKSIDSLCGPGVATLDSCRSRLFAIWTIHLFGFFAKAVQWRDMRRRSENSFLGFGNQAISLSCSGVGREKIVDHALHLGVNFAGGELS
jgi:hypothetical protein